MTMKTLNVLLLDDEKLVRRSLIKIIDWSLPISLVGDFPNGRQAVEWLETTRTHIDIVLTDSLMPEMDGVEFARWVGERYPDALVIFFSGHSEYELMRDAMRTKAYDYILKPVDRNILNTTLKNAVDLLVERNSLQSISDSVLQNILLGKLSSFDALLPRSISVSRLLYINSMEEPIIQCVENLLIRFCRYHMIPFPFDPKGSVFLCLDPWSGGADFFVADLNEVLRSFDGVVVGISGPVCDMDLHGAFLQAWQVSRSLASSRRLCAAIYADTEQNRLLNGIIVYINGHYLEPIGLQEISDRFGYTYAYISRLLTQSLGKSFTDYITGLRLSRAKELLAVPTIKIATVAANSGFSSTTYFNKVFKQIEGMTPVEYRTQLGV